MLLLGPLLVLTGLLWRRKDWRLGLVVAPAATLLGVWSAWTWRTLGIVHLLTAGSWIEFDRARLGGDALAYLSFLGGATLAPPFLLATGLLLRPRGAGAAGALALLGALLAPLPYTLPERVALGLFVTAGLSFLIATWWSRSGPGNDSADRFLLLMASASLASQIGLNIFASVRSLLITLPFLVLLLVRRLEERLPAGQATATLAAGIALAVPFTLSLALADEAFAMAQRDAAAWVVARRPAGGSGRFTGEWGFRHQLEASGFVPLTSQGEPVSEGDLVAVPEVSCPASLPPELTERLRLLETLEAGDDPLRLMSFEAHAGFYSNAWGLLPYALGRGPLERVSLYLVGPARPAAATAGERVRPPAGTVSP
jgi:hypothetical protein